MWLEGPPAGIEVPPARFRSDQAWELGGDGLQMTTPEIVFPIRVPESIPAGRYALRVLGATPDGRVVEARANMIRGPLTNLFNFVRRPLAGITLTVVDRWRKRTRAANRTPLAPPTGSPALRPLLAAPQKYPLTCTNKPVH